MMVRKVKKAYRIKKETEFQHVYRHAETFANRQLVLYVYPKVEQAHFRVGLSVGKRIGNAVKRNQVKRYLRQALHELEAEIPMAYDYLLIARPDIATKDGATIKKSIRHVFGLAKLLQNPHSLGGRND